MMNRSRDNQSSVIEVSDKILIMICNSRMKINKFNHYLMVIQRA